MVVGTWRSLVAHSLGVRGVGSSNLPVPTTISLLLKQLFFSNLPLREPHNGLLDQSFEADGVQSVRAAANERGFSRAMQKHNGVILSEAARSGAAESKDLCFFTTPGQDFFCATPKDLSPR